MTPLTQAKEMATKRAPYVVWGTWKPPARFHYLIDAHQLALTDKKYKVSFDPKGERFPA